MQEQQNNWSVSFTLMDLLMLLSTRLEARNVELQGCLLCAVAILARKGSMNISRENNTFDDTPFTRQIYYAQHNCVVAPNVMTTRK